MADFSWDSAINDYYGNDGTSQFTYDQQLPNDMYTFGGYGDFNGQGTGQSYDPMSGFLQDDPFGPQEINFNTYGQDTTSSNNNNILGSIAKVLGGVTSGLGSSGLSSLLSAGLKGLGANQQVTANNANSKQMIDYLNASRNQQSPADFGANPGSLRAGAQTNYQQAQSALDAFNANPDSNPGNAANKAQISKVLNAQAAMHGNRNNFNYIAPALASAYADSDMKYQNQYMKDRDALAGYAGLNNFYKGADNGAMAQAIALGNLGNSPYYAAGQNVLSNNSYGSNPDLSALLKLFQGIV